MSRPVLKIAFAGWWGGFSAGDNYFYNLLSAEYEVQISMEPHVVFFSAFGDLKNRARLTRELPGLKVFYTGENVRPDFGQCDLALSFDYLDDERNYRLPLWALANRRLGISLLHTGAKHADLSNLVRPRSFNPGLVRRSKTRFCDFVYSNVSARERVRFFDLLCQYKRVDSAGRVRHNTGGLSLPKDGVSKLAFQRECKFTIAFENSSHPGYCTEKILHPFLAHGVPIYWGDPEVARDFNSASFINCHDFDSLEEVVERVAQVDRNDGLYESYLGAPPFHKNRIPEFARSRSVLRWLRPHLERARCVGT